MLIHVSYKVKGSFQKIRETFLELQKQKLIGTTRAGTKIMTRLRLHNTYYWTRMKVTIS